MIEINGFTTSLHTHVKSLFDAQIDADKLAERILEMGGKGIAITDHGVLTSIEDYRPAFISRDLKFIPGVELYVDGGELGRTHLIMLAKNDNGYKGICKIVTESERNLVNSYPVITKDKLFEISSQYKGDIIVTSACMQGVLCSVFLSNKAIQDKIAKAEKKRAEYVSPESDEYQSAKDVVSGCEITVDEYIRDRDDLKTLAEMKFTKREKAIEKMKKEGLDTSKEEAELAYDKKRHENATIELENVKKSLAAAKKSLTNAKKIFETTAKSAENYRKYTAEIEQYTQMLKPKEMLYEEAKALALEYLSVYGTDFYVEVQYHGIEDERVCYFEVARMARELGIPIVATNDVHMLTNSEEDCLRRNILKSLRFGEYQELSEPEKELYLKDNKELAKWLSKILPEDIVTEAINNIDTIFNACNVEFKVGKHYPKYSNTEDTKKLLYDAILEGISERFPDGMTQEYKDRLNYEFKIITSMGYTDYFLVVKDYLEYGRLLGYVPNKLVPEAPLTIEELKQYINDNGWKNGGLSIGPGRGSAVGSIICYLLHITDLDPIKHGLQFERFLNPERVTMPDIDSDFSKTIREKCIEYVKHRYGENAICGIITTNAQAPRGSIRIAAKYYGLKNYGENMIGVYTTITKYVSNDPNISFKTIVDNSGKPSDKGMTLKEYLLKNFSDDKDATNIINWACTIEGIFTQYSSHAAGIIISDNTDISDYIPLKMDKEANMLVSQYDMNKIEDLGLLKFDFLGLVTLDIITDSLKYIEQTTGKIIDPLKIDFEDKNIYREIFSTGNTNSIFQFGSAGMKSMLKRFKPESFDDLIILVSMFRPGPLQYLDDVIEVKSGRKKPSYICKELEPILGKTYGAIVYQEQVMEICQKLAGYTLGRADTVRRYMSKKKADKLAKEKISFIEGCKEHGIKESIAVELFNEMMDFARYAFNKSHAAAYAFNAYITAFLKYYYPKEFYTAALNWADSKAKTAGLVYEATKRDIKVLRPDINRSGVNFEFDNETIRYGLSFVSGVGVAAEEIVKEREKNGPFKDVASFLSRVKPDLKVLTNLIDGGAFDDFSLNRYGLKTYVEETKALRKNIEDKNTFIKAAEYIMPIIESLPTDEAVVKTLKEAGYPVVLKKKTTANNLRGRIDTARDALNAYLKELYCIKVPAVKEDTMTKLNLEKDVLGLYITAHPLDTYPDSSSLGVKNIQDITVSDSVIFGYISKLKVKKRRKDGANMAFLTVEDKTGDIEVIVFVKEYEKFENQLKEGRICKIFGSVLDEDDEHSVADEEKKYKFVFKSLEEVHELTDVIMMKVSSYAIFHAEYEESFRQSYEEHGDNGRKLLIYDSCTGQIRKMTYTVKDRLLKLPNVREISEKNIM